jgi:TolA-binding protein
VEHVSQSRQIEELTKQVESLTERVASLEQVKCDTDGMEKKIDEINARLHALSESAPEQAAHDHGTGET